MSFSYSFDGTNPLSVQLQYTIAGDNAYEIANFSEYNQQGNGFAGGFLYFPLNVPSTQNSSPAEPDYLLYYAYGASIYVSQKTALPVSQPDAAAQYLMYTLSSPASGEQIIGLSPLYQDVAFGASFLYLLTGTWNAGSVGTSSCTLIPNVSRLILLQLVQGSLAVDNTFSFNVTETQICLSEDFQLPSGVQTSNMQYPIPMIGCGGAQSSTSNLFNSVCLLSVPSSATSSSPQASQVGSTIYQCVVNTTNPSSSFTNTYTTSSVGTDSNGDSNWFQTGSYIYALFQDANAATGDSVQVLSYVPDTTNTSLQLIPTYSSNLPLVSNSSTFTYANYPQTQMTLVAQVSSTTYNLPLAPLYIGLAIPSDYCFQQCNNTDCSQGVESYCVGQTLLTSFCQEYCISGTFSYNCNAKFENLCAPNNPYDIKASSYPICSCFLGAAFYENYFMVNNFSNLSNKLPESVLNDLKVQVQSMTDAPWCTYPNCSANITVQPRDASVANCPAEIICLAATDISVSGQAQLNVGKLQIVEENTCSGDTSFNNLLNELNNSPAGGAGALVWKWWYTIVLAVAIIVFVAALIYGIYATGPKKTPLPRR